MTDEQLKARVEATIAMMTATFGPGELSRLAEHIENAARQLDGGEVFKRIFALALCIKKLERGAEIFGGVAMDAEQTEAHRKVLFATIDRLVRQGHEQERPQA